jgi:hypothetical protein
VSGSGTRSRPDLVDLPAAHTRPPPDRDIRPEPRRVRALHIPHLVKRHLWVSPYADQWQGFLAQFKSYDRAVLLVRLFYAASLYFVVESMAEWPALLHAEALSAPWPSSWIPAASVPTVIPWILGAYLVSAVVVVALPQWRVARGLYFLALVQYVSVISGFGSISHNNHTWLWVSGLLILLPDRGWAGVTTTEHRHYFLSVFWVSQIVVLAFYALTGWWKILLGAQAMFTDRVSTFEIRGFGLTIMNQQMRVNQDPLVSDFLVRNSVLAWALFVGTMYVESASLAVAFRPRLHRLWGILLIAFHIGTELAMGFTFLPPVLLAGILFVCSPFAPRELPVRQVLTDLPGVRVLHRLTKRGGRRR